MGEKLFFDLLCERILIKILQGFQLPLFTLMLSSASLSLFCSSSSHPTFPSQTSCAVPCSHDLPLLCNVLHTLPWKGKRSHNAISTFQNVPHCAHESKAQPDADLNRKLRHNCP